MGFDMLEFECVGIKGASETASCWKIQLDLSSDWFEEICIKPHLMVNVQQKQVFDVD